MGKAHPAKSSFNAGEWSPRMRGRADLEKYANSCEELENLVPLRQGPAVSRPGALFIDETKAGAGDDPAFLAPYVIDEEEAYILEFVWDGSTSIVFYVYDQDGAETGAGPVAVTAMTSSNDLFDGQNRPRIKYAQNQDEMWLVHKDYAPHKITFDGSSWAITQPAFQNGPYFDNNTVAANTLTPSATSGSGVTITSVNNTFVSTDVGRLIRFNDSAGNWSWFEITSHTDAKNVVVTIRGPNLPDLTPQNVWALGLWSDTTGYPTAVTFHEARLCFNGPDDAAARVDASVPFLYTNFRPSDTDATVRANDAISAVLYTKTSNKVRWIESGDKGLAVGTGGGNFMIRPTATDSGLSPLNIEAPQVTRIGNANISPVMVDEVALFVQTAQRQLHEFVYSFDLDSFQVPDITILADHISGGSKIIDMAYQRSPHSIVWCVLQNGGLVGMTYDRSQDVVGWFNAPIAGTDARVRSVTVIPDDTNNNDQVWICVRRDIDGSEPWHIEQIQPFWEDGDSVEDAIFVDSAVVYSGASTTTISGLGHLEGEEVAVLGDGGVQSAATVTGGSITVDPAVEKATVGLAYTQKVTTQKFEAGSADGTSQGKIGRISSVVFRFWQSLGGRVRAGGDEWENIDYREADDLMDTGTGTFTGDYESISIPSEHNRDCTVTFENPDPTPVTLVAIYPTIDKGGR